MLIITGRLLPRSCYKSSSSVVVIASCPSFFFSLTTALTVFWLVAMDLPFSTSDTLTV